MSLSIKAEIRKCARIRTLSPDDRLMTFEPGGLPKSWRISAVRRNAADLYLVVNDPMTGEPVEPDLMALLRDGCFDFDRSRETPEWQGF